MWVAVWVRAVAARVHQAWASVGRGWGWADGVVGGGDPERFAVAGDDPGPVQPGLAAGGVGGVGAEGVDPGGRVGLDLVGEGGGAGVHGGGDLAGGVGEVAGAGGGEGGEGDGGVGGGGFGVAEPPVQHGGEVVGVVEGFWAAAAARAAAGSMPAVSRRRSRAARAGQAGERTVAAARSGPPIAARACSAWRVPWWARRSCQMGKRVARLTARLASSAWTWRAAVASGGSGRSRMAASTARGSSAGPSTVGAFGSGADDVGVVLVAAAGEPDVDAGPGGAGGEDGVGGVAGAALGGVDGGGVAELDPVGHIAGVEVDGVVGAGPGDARGRRRR